MPRSSKVASEIPRPRLSGFAPAIDLLLAFGIPAKRLAELFGTNPDYVYVLAHRGRLGASRHVAEDDEVHIKTAIPSSVDVHALEANSALRIRAEEDAVELTRSKATKLEWLESRIEDIVSSGRNTYQFLQAARSLKALKPYIGYPSESNRLRLAAKLHQHLAWFYSHSGFTSSSIAEAARSIQLHEIAYNNTGDKDALRELGGSCLISSNSHLLQGQPEGAIAVLNIAREATEAAGIALNSDYFRQQGVARFQTREDRMAQTMFERAMATTADSQTGRTAFLPAWVTWDQDGWKIEPLRWKGSADIIGFSRANATVIFPGDRDSLHSGDQVEAMLLPDYSLRSRNPLAGVAAE
jgi:hypothetical protein